MSDTEQLRLEYNRLVQEHPDLASKLPGFPLKVFTGKALPKPGSRAVFFCYRIPRPDMHLIETETGEPRWSDKAGITVWTCYDLKESRILTDTGAGAIAELIRSVLDTARHCEIEKTTLSDIRKKVEKQLVTDFLRPLQAPVGISPILKCWMELN